jgi:cytochrome c553
VCLLFAERCAVTLAAEQPSAEVKQQPPMFERDVAPILTAYCWKCHGSEARVAELDLRSLPLLLKGGKSGPAIVRGSAESSLLYQKLSQQQMPPKKELKPTAKHVETIRAWLAAGAPARYEKSVITESESPPLTDEDRSWWSFRKPIRPAVPVVSRKERARTPIDTFLLQRLSERGLGFSPDADRVTLIRRAYFDVIGLPPSPKQVDAFLADTSSDAYETLIEGLLASPHYGERWGRHWLDAAGYADTLDGDIDAAHIRPREGVWKYRDYVIQSFNDDQPYDRFLTEQLAGDELVEWRTAKKFTPEIKQQLIATGFLRHAADFTFDPPSNIAIIRHQVLYDTIQILATNVMGLTLHCAQCHSHKFDPISQADYYRLAAILRPSLDPQRWKHSQERFLDDVSTAEKLKIDAHNANVDGRIEPLKKLRAEVRGPFEKTLFDSKLTEVPQPLRVDVREAINTSAKKRNPAQAELVKKYGTLLTVTPEEVDKSLDESARKRSTELQRQVDQLQAEKQSTGKLQALWELGPPPPTYLYRRGNFRTPGAQIQPGVIAVLDNPQNPFVIPEAKPGRETSGYRTALARWLVNPNHPLTARVMVNRVWQQYFSRGIVATPQNFGLAGAEPTHPELLDWLATEFIHGGWSLKHLHRLILTSTGYRQASRRPDDVVNADSAGTQKSGQSPDPYEADPENLLLWRMPLRRLESEVIRDRILAVSGALNRAQGGPPVPLKTNPDGSVEIDTANLLAPSDRSRRSVYLLARRNYQLTELNVFDQPILRTNCTKRTSSAVVLQSLAMLNGKFVFEQSERFAARVMQTAGPDEAKRIETAFRLSLTRTPTVREVAICRTLLDKQTARYQKQKNLNSQQAADAALVNLCHTLLDANEFLYVE